MIVAARTKQLAMSAGGGEALFHGGRGMLLGLESPLEIAGPCLGSSSRDVRRIGKIRMTWEESVSLWAEEGEVHRGRVRIQASSFLKAEELCFFDESMVPCTMECFEDGPLRGFSVDRFISGQQVKVFGRRKYCSSASAPAAGTPTNQTNPVFLTNCFFLLHILGIQPSLCYLSLYQVLLKESSFPPPNPSYDVSFYY